MFLAVQISGTMGTMFDSTVDNICIGCETKKQNSKKDLEKSVKSKSRFSPAICQSMVTPRTAIFFKWQYLVGGCSIGKKDFHGACLIQKSLEVGDFANKNKS